SINHSSISIPPFPSRGSSLYYFSKIKKQRFYSFKDMPNVQPILQHVFKKSIGESPYTISPSTTTSSKSAQNARVIQQHSVPSARVPYPSPPFLQGDHHYIIFQRLRNKGSIHLKICRTCNLYCNTYSKRV